MGTYDVAPGVSTFTAAAQCTVGGLAWGIIAGDPANGELIANDGKKRSTSMWVLYCKTLVIATLASNDGCSETVTTVFS